MRVPPTSSTARPVALSYPAGHLGHVRLGYSGMADLAALPVRAQKANASGPQMGQAFFAPVVSTLVQIAAAVIAAVIGAVAWITLTATKSATKADDTQQEDKAKGTFD